MWKRLLDQMRVVPFEHAKSELVGDGFIDSCVTFPGTMNVTFQAKGSQTASVASRIIASMQYDSAGAAEEEDVARSVLGTAYIGEAAATPFSCSF